MLWNLVTFIPQVMWFRKLTRLGLSLLHYIFLLMFSLIWLLLLTYTTSVIPQNLSSTDTNYAFLSQSKSIFILAGQSNMAGRGGVTNGTWDGVVPSHGQPDPRILRLSRALAWEEAREPLHRDIDANKTCGIGPAMVFANYVLNRDKGIGEIGLVPCAIGGTNISQWRRGGHLYNQLMSRAQAALAAGGGSGGLIKSILWYQGESDTRSFEDAELYKNRLEKLFLDIREDLRLPVLPVIQVALASGEGPYVDVIRRAQLGIDLPNVRTVDAYGLQLEPDGLHLTTASQVQLGGMLADAFLKITAPLPVQSSASKRFHSSFLGFLPVRLFRLMFELVR